MLPTDEQTTDGRTDRQSGLTTRPAFAKATQVIKIKVTTGGEQWCKEFAYQI